MQEWSYGARKSEAGAWESQILPRRTWAKNRQPQQIAAIFGKDRVDIALLEVKQLVIRQDSNQAAKVIRRKGALKEAGLLWKAKFQMVLSVGVDKNAGEMSVL